MQTQLAGLGRQLSERADLAVKALELSQSLLGKWVTADIAERRQLLEIVGLNWTLNDVTLVPEMRKPFDLLAKGLVSKDSRVIRTPFERPTSGIRASHSDVSSAVKGLAAIFSECGRGRLTVDDKK